MKAIATELTPHTLGGGKTGANAIPAGIIRHAGTEGLVERGHPGYHSPAIRTLWAPDASERAALATGAMLELLVWGQTHPPVNVNVQRGVIEGGLLGLPALWSELSMPLVEDLLRLLGDGEQATAALADLREFLRKGLDELKQREEATG